MTVYLPLNNSSPLPPSPSFLVPAKDHAAHLAKAFQAIMKARRIVVICGAGISVQAGIPDFRSADGLFQSIKRDNPKEAMSSGKELFDVSVFNSEQKTSLFCQMIAQLSDLSQAAEPTSFHHVLRELDDRGRLLRVYTQNIDAIEQKSGLSFGVPEFEGKRGKGRAKAKSKAAATAAAEDIAAAVMSADQQQQQNDESSGDPVASTSRLPSPPAETPRCIPLHGTLQSMHCQICNHSSPLLAYLPSLASGVPPSCPECTSLEATRQLVGKRPRGIGRLRPSVVLYNEMHKDGEGVGDVVQKDLMGASKGKGRSGADLLLVVGTSLRVPGTKRMVREFAKAVRSRGVGSSTTTKDEQQQQAPTTTPGSRTTANSNRTSTGLATPAPSPRRSPTADDESVSANGGSGSVPMKAIYLNLDFPVPTREWEGVFDAWIQGDAQEFAEMLRKEIGKEARAKEAKEVLVEKRMKKKREEEMGVQEQDKEEEEEGGEGREKGEVAEAMLGLAGKGKEKYALRDEEEEEEEEEEGPAEDELPDYRRVMLQREREKKTKAKAKETEKEKGRKHQQQYGSTSAKRKLGQASKNASSSSSSSSLSSLSSAASSPSSSSSLMTPPTPTSLGKRRKASLPLSPPCTPVVRRKVKGGEASLSTTRSGKEKEKARGENIKMAGGANDEQAQMKLKQTRSKLLVRIPSRAAAAAAAVRYSSAAVESQDLYVKTTKAPPPPPPPRYTQPQPPLQPYYSRTAYAPPLHMRPYEFLRGDRMDVDVDEEMDVDVDVVGDGRQGYDYEHSRTRAHANFSPLSRYAGGVSPYSHSPIQTQSLLRSHSGSMREHPTAGRLSPHSHSPIHSQSLSRSRSGSMREHDHEHEMGLSPTTTNSLSRHHHHPVSYARAPSIPSSSPTTIRVPPRAQAVFPPNYQHQHHNQHQYHHPHHSQALGTAAPPPRLNDRHRLGGRIDHSHTLLSLGMARTSLQLGARDSA